MKYRIKETGVIVDGKDSLKSLEMDAAYYGFTLEPYVEPVKKLVAVREISSGEIKFYDQSLIFLVDSTAPKLRELAPEFDITYPKEQ